MSSSTTPELAERTQMLRRHAYSANLAIRTFRYGDHVEAGGVGDEGLRTSHFGLLTPFRIEVTPHQEQEMRNKEEIKKL